MRDLSGGSSTKPEWWGEYFLGGDQLNQYQLSIPNGQHCI